jgi:hypothetical protein
MGRDLLVVTEPREMKERWAVCTNECLRGTLNGWYFRGVARWGGGAAIALLGRRYGI